MKSKYKIVILLVLLLALASCAGAQDELAEPTVDPTDCKALVASITPEPDQIGRATIKYLGEGDNIVLEEAYPYRVCDELGQVYATIILSQGQIIMITSEYSDTEAASSVTLSGSGEVYDSTGETWLVISYGDSLYQIEILQLPTAGAISKSPSNVVIPDGGSDA